MSRFKLCFIFDENGDYKPVPYSKLMDGGKRRIEFENRYFIPLTGYLLEVTHEDYLEHYRIVNRQCYLRKESKRTGEVSLEAIISADSEIIRDVYNDVADQVITSMMAESLHSALALLSENERQIINMLYYDEQTEQHCADVFGVNQSTVSRWKQGILENLKNILKI